MIRSGDHFTQALEESSEPYCVVIGGINIDIQGFCKAAHREKDSNPGKAIRSLGGVGRNIAENLVRLGIRTELITVLGNSPAWETLISRTEHLGIGLSHSPRIVGVPLPMYLCILERDGSLVSAVSDMRAITRLEIEHLRNQDSLMQKAACIIIDGNLPKACIEWIAQQYRSDDLEKKNAIRVEPRSIKPGNDVILRNFAGIPEKDQDLGQDRDRAFQNANKQSQIGLRQHPLLIADPVSSAKAPKFRRCFGSFAIAKPNLIEASAIADLGPTAAPVEIIAALKDKAILPKELYLSLGAKGMLVVEDESLQAISLPASNLCPPSVNRSGAGDAACAALAWLSVWPMFSERLKNGQWPSLRPSAKAKFAISAALLTSASKRSVNPQLNPRMLCEMTKFWYPELSDLAEYMMQYGGIA